MEGTFQIKTLYIVLKDIFTFLNGKSGEKKANIIAARKATNDAFIQTYDYLRNQKGNYVPKPELATAWNDASAAVMLVDISLGDMLHSKSRFWLDPDLYINLGREDEIIELKEIVDEMERLRKKLK